MLQAQSKLRLHSITRLFVILVCIGMFYNFIFAHSCISNCIATTAHVYTGRLHISALTISCFRFFLALCFKIFIPVFIIYSLLHIPLNFIIIRLNTLHSDLMSNHSRRTLQSISMLSPTTKKRHLHNYHYSLPFFPKHLVYYFVILITASQELIKPDPDAHTAQKLLNVLLY